jgi:hypothetical protein
MQQAVKGWRGLAAEVRYAEVLASRPAWGTGTIRVSYQGRVRADIIGDKAVTFVSAPPYLYVHRPEFAEVEVYNLERNPDRIVQYALLGFAPTGKALKKAWHVELRGRQPLEDGGEALEFLLRPKSKSVAAALDRVELAVDPVTWLPAQQKIYQAGTDLHLVIRYVEPTRDDALDEMLFVPKWPAGTRQILK